MTSESSKTLSSLALPHSRERTSTSESEYSDSSSSSSSSSSSHSERSAASEGDEDELPTTPTDAQTLMRSVGVGGSHDEHAHGQERERSSKARCPPSIRVSTASVPEENSKQQPSTSAGTGEYPAPIFSTIPTRRVHSSSALSPTTTSPTSGHGFGHSSSPLSASSSSCSASGYGSGSRSPVSGSASPTSSTFPRRIPSFPVSRPLRPFDSITNAMGTAPRRVSPPLSRSESPSPISPLSATSKSSSPREENDGERMELKTKDKLLQIRTKNLSLGNSSSLENGKQKRSNVLLAPPKSNRFQNGYFILDMTQDEFKTRSW